MPNMDGIEALKVIMEENYPNGNDKIIVLTANALVGAREEYINAGFTDYLTKPVNSECLEETLVKYLPRDKVEIL